MAPVQPRRIGRPRWRPLQLGLAYPRFRASILRLLTPPLSAAAGAAGKGVSAKMGGEDRAIGGVLVPPRPGGKSDSGRSRRDVNDLDARSILETLDPKAPTTSAAP